MLKMLTGARKFCPLITVAIAMAFFAHNAYAVAPKECSNLFSDSQSLAIDRGTSSSRNNKLQKPSLHEDLKPGDFPLVELPSSIDQLIYAVRENPSPLQIAVFLKRILPSGEFLTKENKLKIEYTDSSIVVALHAPVRRRVIEESEASTLVLESRYSVEFAVGSDPYLASLTRELRSITFDGKRVRIVTELQDKRFYRTVFEELSLSFNQQGYLSEITIKNGQRLFLYPIWGKLTFKI